MFPIRDSIPTVHTPLAVWTIMALNTAAFFFTQGLTDVEMFRLFHLYGVVPARYLAPPQWAEMIYPANDILPFLTSMFLHSGWLHFLFNMWILWIFADNIEDVMGPMRFTAFYLVCGLAAIAAHMLFNTRSTIPVVGASGAIAGVLGAYFLLYPHSKVTTVIPIFFIPYVMDLPALIFLGIWFATQLISGVVETAAGGTGGGIAWWAHAGGFIAGMALLPSFRRRGHCYYCIRPEGARPQTAPADTPPKNNGTH